MFKQIKKIGEFGILYKLNLFNNITENYEEIDKCISDEREPFFLISSQKNMDNNEKDIKDTNTVESLDKNILVEGINITSSSVTDYEDDDELTKNNKFYKLNLLNIRTKGTNQRHQKLECVTLKL